MSNWQLLFSLAGLSQITELAKSRKKRVQFMEAVPVFAPKSEINIFREKNSN